MKKSDLQTGMIVETRDGTEYAVLLDICKIDFHPNVKNILIHNNYGWLNLDDYTEDMKDRDNEDNSDFDIMKVYIPNHPFSFINLEYQRAMRTLIWEREEIKEITMKELEDHFGCKVKIVES